MSLCIYMFIGIIGCIIQLLTKLWYAPRTLQDAFKRALTLEAGLHMAESVHLGSSLK